MLPTFDVFYMNIICICYQHSMFSIWTLCIYVTNIRCFLYEHYFYMLPTFDVFYMNIMYICYQHSMFSIWTLCIYVTNIRCFLYEHYAHMLPTFDVFYINIMYICYQHSISISPISHMAIYRYVTSVLTYHLNELFSPCTFLVLSVLNTNINLLTCSVLVRLSGDLFSHLTPHW